MSASVSLRDSDIEMGVYPVGSGVYVRLVHTPTGVSAGKELSPSTSSGNLRREDVDRMRKKLRFILTSRVKEWNANHGRR